jgi:hypothetical protein
LTQWVAGASELPDDRETIGDLGRAALDLKRCLSLKMARVNAGSFGHS